MSENHLANMEKNKYYDQIMLKVVSLIRKNKPEFGSLTLELSYHQNKLSRVKIINKINTIIYEKTSYKEENHGA
jgi:hypothetical protein